MREGDPRSYLFHRSSCQGFWQSAKTPSFFPPLLIFENTIQHTRDLDRGVELLWIVRPPRFLPPGFPVPRLR